MARNYAKETAKRNESTKQFAFRVEKEQGEKFLERLKELNINLADWFRSKIDETMPLDVSKEQQLDVKSNIRQDVDLYTADEAITIRSELDLKGSLRTLQRAVASGRVNPTKTEGRTHYYDYETLIGWDGRGS